MVGYSAVGLVWELCLVGMDYTRYSALQSSTVSYAVTYLGEGWVLWLVGWDAIYIQSTNPSTLLFQLHLSLRGYTVNQRHILRLVARCRNITPGSMSGFNRYPCRVTQLRSLVAVGTLRWLYVGHWAFSTRYKYLVGWLRGLFTTLVTGGTVRNT